MPPKPPFLAAGALALVVSACASASMQTDAPDMPSGERPNETQRGAPPPKPRRNPQAVPYEITLRIENAPGPFEAVRAAMQYEVANERCLPRLGGISGTRVTAREWVEVDVERTGPDTYRARVFDDLMVDEDYYGLGVCEWQLVTVQFKLTAAGGGSVLAHHLFRDDVLQGRRIDVHFWKGRYAAGDPRFAHVPVYGETDPARYKPELRDELFVFRFASHRGTP